MRLALTRLIQKYMKISELKKSLWNYKKKSPLFLSHKHETEREGFKYTTSAKEIGFLPLIQKISNRVFHSGDSSSHTPLLLQRVLTLQTSVCWVRKRQDCQELQVQNWLFANFKNQGTSLTRSTWFFWQVPNLTLFRAKAPVDFSAAKTSIAP